jgi:hypothetical protein
MLCYFPYENPNSLFLAMKNVKKIDCDKSVSFCMLLHIFETISENEIETKEKVS